MRPKSSLKRVVRNKIAGVYFIFISYFIIPLVKSKTKVLLQVENKIINLTFPGMINPVTWDIHAFPVFFGGTERSEDGLIISVPSVQLVYFGNADSKKLDQM